MSKNLAKKAGLIQAPPSGAQANAAARPAGTAPGAMLSFLAGRSETMEENQKLRRQVEEFDGAHPTKLLDPTKVRPSRWANRDERNYTTPEYLELKREIQAKGRNVQPIKVRPVLVDGETAYEIVFGHRRHRACLELGLAVLAMIEEMSEVDLFVEMEFENRNRLDPSPWEQGVMYLRALKEGLYPSNTKLAEAIHRDASDVGKAISLAKLPPAIVEAFPSPLDLQFRWAKPLSDLLQADPDLAIKRAKDLKSQGEGRNAKAVFEALIAPAQSSGAANAPSTRTVLVQGKEVGEVRFGRKGEVTVKLSAGSLPKGHDKFVEGLQKLLGG